MIFNGLPSKGSFERSKVLEHLEKVTYRVVSVSAYSLANYIDL
jgi:hypothetical protein